MAAAQQAIRPVRLFVSYSHEDARLHEALEDHLAGLRRARIVDSWSDGRILPGQPWRNSIQREMDEADIFLLLVSASFLASDFCYEQEMMRALERHQRGDAVVIPVLLRPVEWSTTPLAELQCLPRNALPVVCWRHRDLALKNVAEGVHRAATALRTGIAAPDDPSAGDLQVVKQRELDAAIQSTVYLGGTAEVLAMVSVSGAAGLRELLRSEPQMYSASESDVRSEAFNAEFSVDASGRAEPLSLNLVAESSDFEPAVASKKVRVPPNGDSPVCALFLRPKRAGVLRLQLDLRKGDETLVSQRLMTTAKSAPAAEEESPPLYSVAVLEVVPGARAQAPAPAPVRASRRTGNWRGAMLALSALGLAGLTFSLIRYPQKGRPPATSEKSGGPPAAPSQPVDVESDMEKTISELKSASGDLGLRSGLIASNSKELLALKALGEKDYFEFKLRAGETQTPIEFISLRLLATDRNRGRFSLLVNADGRPIDKSNRAINEPLQFFLDGLRQPCEIVVNEVTADSVSGYLAVPKVRSRDDNSKQRPR
jgi:hypothetical protein